MRNVVRTTFVKEDRSCAFDILPAGTLFRFKCPWTPENIYMKTVNYQGRCVCVQLNTGSIFPVEMDKPVVPLGSLEQVDIRNP